MPWSTMTPLPTSLMGLAAATFDAPAPGSGYRIYAIAGLTSDIASPSGFDAVATVVAYDPQAPNSGWKPVASISSERSFLAAASVPGALHVLGGILNSQEIVTTHEVYDAAANVWSQTTPLPTPRANHAAVIGHDGRIYVIGGQDANNNPLNTVDAFDPLSKVWSSAVHPMQTARESPAAVTAPNGKIYVICGWVPYESGVSEHPLDTVEIYDPGSNSWSFGPSLPNTPGGSGLYKLGAAVGPDGLIYVMGGFDFEQGSSSTLYSLDPSNPNAQWLTQPPMTSARGGLAAVTGPDGLIYAIGGGGFQGTLDVVEAYNIVANTSTKPDPYIGNGTYQSPDIILMNIMTNEVVPIGGKPGGAWDTLLIPNMNYTLQCVVYNDANVAAPNTKVRFWHFPGGVGTAGALISEETVTVPANGSIVVTSSNPFQSGALGAHECAVVSLANAQSQYFSNDPTTAAAVIDPTVPHPVGSGHFGSAWRNTNSVAMGGEIKIWNFPFVANLGGIEPARVNLTATATKVAADWDRTDEIVKLRKVVEGACSDCRLPLFLIPEIRAHLPSADCDLRIRVGGNDNGGSRSRGRAEHNAAIKPGENAPFQVSGRIPDDAQAEDIFLVNVAANYPAARGRKERIVEYLEVIYVR